MNSDLERLVQEPDSATVEEITRLLQLQGEDLKTLYRKADMVRKNNVGDAIYLRGVIHHSTFCKHDCDYCPQRASNSSIKRYRMMPGEIANAAHQAMHFGCTTLVLHSGDDDAFTCGHLCEIVDRIKLFPNFSVALSIGVRKEAEFKYFREYGVDKFMLRFETSDRELYSKMARESPWENRVGNLLMARQYGLQTSSGFLIGWPHQELDLIAKDIIFTTSFTLDEICCDPFVSQRDTPLACKPFMDDREVYFRTIALLRLLNKNAHIVSSPAFNAVKRYGADQALIVGANVLIVSMTPERYECPNVYSNFTAERDKSAQHGQEMLSRLIKLGRKMARDPGPSFRSAWIKAHPEEFE